MTDARSEISGENQKHLVGLFDVLQAAQPAPPTEVDPTKLRYAMYTRKSTTDEDRQEKSIPDQIADCRERILDPLGITIKDEDIIKERQSAKQSGIRPLFAKLLQDLRDGKYQGVIAYHPDRLARNMGEAGDIIDLLDMHIIRDLRFATFTFENNPMGKMLLGITFVLSKQYSENLGDVVKRGFRRRVEAGIFSGQLKHGYMITEEGRLYPDGNNFLLISEAFRRRVAGASQDEIAEFLNSSEYEAFKRGVGHQPYSWNKQRVSEFLSDPFFTGILRRGQNMVVLTEVYDFTPAVSVKDFRKINRLDKITGKLASASHSVPRTLKADLLVQRVTCAECEGIMSTGMTPKKKADGEIRHYFYYRCENNSCPQYGKSVRAKVIVEFLSGLLEDQDWSSRALYEKYQEEAEVELDAQNAVLSSRIASARRRLRDRRRDYDNAKKAAANPNSTMARHYAEDLDPLRDEVESLESELTEALQGKANLKEVILTYEKFLELLEKSAQLLRFSPSFATTKQIVESILSNCSINKENVVNYRLKEPFAQLLSTDSPAWRE